jgi:hypothetical protein
MSHSTPLPKILTADDAIENHPEVDFSQWPNLADLLSTEFDPGLTNDQTFVEPSANDLLDIEVSGPLTLQPSADIF